MIAGLWSDWIKRDSDPTGPMILYALVDNQPIIEWNQIEHYSSSPGRVIFQVILTLDTNGNPGDITINYVNLDTGDMHAEGRTSTVGIKDSGTQTGGTSRLLVSLDGSSPLIGTGQAVLLTVGAGNGGSGAADRGPDRRGHRNGAGRPVARDAGGAGDAGALAGG